MGSTTRKMRKIVLASEVPVRNQKSAEVRKSIDQERLGLLGGLHEFSSFQLGRLFLNDLHTEVSNLAQVQAGEFLHLGGHRFEDVLDHIEAIRSRDGLDEVAQDFPVIVRFAGGVHRVIEALETTLGIDH